MKFTEHQKLKAELSQVEVLLGRVPETHIIDRLSLQARRNALLAELETSPVQETTRVLLTFQGRPVIESHGIFAEFGAKAVNAFVSTVTAFGASLSRPLGARGALPNRDEYQLLITGEALGSFGFELEEYQPQPVLPVAGLSLVGRAVEQIQIVMRASQNSEDELADAISESDRRAINALREFFHIVGSNEATCALQFREHLVRFTSIEQITRSETLLSTDNIQEEQTIQGTFQGVLPGRRTFEFKITDPEEVVVGKVHSSIIDADEINSVLKREVQIQCLVTRVGEGKPRYTLLEYRLLDERE